MTAELEFHVGGATVDMVEEVWTEVLGELATPGSPIHQHYDTTGLDLTQPIRVRVEERNGCFGTTIVVFVLVTIAQSEIERWWQDIVRPRLIRRFGVDTGEDVEVPRAS